MSNHDKIALQRAQKAAKRRIAFGLHIRFLRERIGIPQEELARRLKLTRTSVVNIEHGRSAPPLTSLPEYAKALETSITILGHGIHE